MSRSTIDGTDLDAARDRVGQEIRSTHPFGFRVGQWGRVLALTIVHDRWCYMVAWADEVCDVWVVDDPDDPYEFRGQP